MVFQRKSAGKHLVFWGTYLLDFPDLAFNQFWSSTKLRKPHPPGSAPLHSAQIFCRLIHFPGRTFSEAQNIIRYGLANWFAFLDWPPTSGVWLFWKSYLPTIFFFCWGSSPLPKKSPKFCADHVFFEGGPAIYSCLNHYDKLVPPLKSTDAFAHSSITVDISYIPYFQPFHIQSLIFQKWVYTCVNIGLTITSHSIFTSSH